MGKKKNFQSKGGPTIASPYTSHSDESDSDAEEIEVKTDTELSNPSGLKILCGTQSALKALQDALAEKPTKISKEQQLKVSLNVTNVLGSVAQLLLEKEELRGELNSARTSIKVLQAEKLMSDNHIKQLLDKIQQLESDLGPVMRRVADATEASLSFAEVTKKKLPMPPPLTRTSIPIGKPRPSVCFFPKLTDVNDSDATKKIIKDIVKPSQLGVRITGVKNIKNKGVIIHTASSQEQERLLNASIVTSSNMLTARLPVKRQPRVIFFNVPRELSDEGFLEKALSGISEVNDMSACIGQCKLSHMAGPRTGLSCHRVYAVPANIRHALVQQGRIFVDWTVCGVRDFIGLTVCLNCQMVGHSHKFCTATKRCAHCGEEGHAREVCPVATAAPSCATCARFGKPATSRAHPTGHKDCPAYKAALLRDLSTIDYGV